MAKSTLNGPFSIANLNYQRVIIFIGHMVTAGSIADLTRMLEFPFAPRPYEQREGSACHAKPRWEEPWSSAPRGSYTGLPSEKITCVTPKAEIR